MKETINFPVGYHEFNKNKAFNFQMNRLYSMGNARLKDLQDVGPGIQTMDEWKHEMLRLAENAISEKQLMQAAFYYRAAEFYISETDPEKEALYQLYLDCFYKAVGQNGIQQREIPYRNSSIQTIRLQPENTQARGTIIIHGGFDSFKEELYPMMRYFQQEGYMVINFETPWMGGSRKKSEMGLEIEWEKLIGAVIDAYGLDEITLIGMSMGGWLALRAAALEPRISKVIASSVSFDVNQYNGPMAQKLAGLFFKRFRKFTNKAIEKKMKKDVYYSWFMNHLMYTTNKTIPIDAMEVLMQFNEENLHSDLVRQDVLILTGKEDHAVPFKMHKKQVDALTHANSVTERVFTSEDNAQYHCQVGNLGLALETMLNWIER